MSQPPVFPTLAGQGWSVHKRPLFSTRVAAHVSGREVRSPFYAAALYEFELTFDALASAADTSTAGLGAASLQNLLGFFLQAQGQFGTFLYVDPTDSTVTAQAIGTGDGATTSFPLVRTLGAATETVGWVTALSAVTVGGAPASGWTLVPPNLLSFAVAPAAGAAISASLSYAFQCRFGDDTADFENVAAGLWQVGSLKFRSVRS